MLSRLPLVDVTSTKNNPAPFGSVISWLFLAGRWSRHGLGNGGRPEILRNVCSLWGKWGEKPSSSAGFCSALCWINSEATGSGWFGTTPWWFGSVVWLPINQKARPNSNGRVYPTLCVYILTCIYIYMHIYIYNIYIYIQYISVCVRERVCGHIYIYAHYACPLFSIQCHKKIYSTKLHNN